LILFFLIFGGLSIIIGAGKQDSGQVEKGSKAVLGAVLGLVVVFLSYFIVKLVELVTGVKILSPGL
jgi:hypothetical protein